MDSMPIRVHTFDRYMLTSLSVDEILMPRYIPLFTNFRDLSLSVDIGAFCFV